MITQHTACAASPMVQPVQSGGLRPLGFLEHSTCQMFGSHTTRQMGSITWEWHLWKKGCVCDMLSVHYHKHHTVLR